jgi:hypothetical protein
MDKSRKGRASGKQGKDVSVQFEIFMPRMHGKSNPSVYPWLFSMMKFELRYTGIRLTSEIPVVEKRHSFRCGIMIIFVVWKQQ